MNVVDATAGSVSTGYDPDFLRVFRVEFPAAGNQTVEDDYASTRARELATTPISRWP